jgi:hypothetical protein
MALRPVTPTLLVVVSAGGHIHAVVRTPNGNDYGKDLLRLPLQQHPHTAGYGEAK